MIKCPNCGKMNYLENKFCGACGTKLPGRENYCPNCNVLYFEGEKFCTQCGKKLVNEEEYYLEKERIKKEKEEKERREINASYKKIFDSFGNGEREIDEEVKRKIIERETLPKMKPCKKCGRSINRVAKKCPYCNYVFE